MKILIIVPAFNEEANIVDTVNEIKKYKKYKLDYIVINDGSNDNTKKVLKANKIKYVDLVANLGIGGAVQTGYKYAYKNDYDIAIQFDGDGQHDINYVNNLIEPIINDGYNFVVGSRFMGLESEFKSTFIRRIGIKIISKIIKTVTNFELKDVTSGYRAADRKVIERFSKKYVLEYPEPITNLELLQEGFKVKEVPVNMKERKHGKSFVNPYTSIYYMVNVILSMIIISTNRRKKNGK